MCGACSGVSGLGDGKRVGDVGLQQHGFRLADQGSGGSSAATVGCTLKCDPPDTVFWLSVIRNGRWINTS